MAIVFNAAADALFVDNSGSVTRVPSGARTVTCWVRMDTDRATNQTAVQVGGQYSSVLEEIGSITNAASFGITEATWSTRATLGITVGTWAFIAFTSDNAATPTLVAYEGNESTAVSQTSGTFMSAKTVYEAYIGSNAYNNYFAGAISQVRMWSAVLSSAEIEAERTSATAVRTTNLVSEWRLASVGAILDDSSGNGHSLTNPGSAGSWTTTAEPSTGGGAITGTGAPALPVATLAASGALPVQGTSSATLPVASLAASGALPVQGTSSATLPVASLAASGTTAIAGTLAASLPVATLAASGTVQSTVTGTLAASLPVATLAASGTTVVAGTLAASLPVATLAASSTVYAPIVMPHISLGKPVYGTGTPGRMNDNGYGYVDTPGAWACGAASWVALNLGAGPTQILVSISNDGTTGTTWQDGDFEAYRIQVSDDSTDGNNGTWTTSVTVTGSTGMAREHLVSFTGYSWVKLIVDGASGGQLDELDVWDASAGTANTFGFVGDSITNMAMLRHTWFGGGYRPSVQDTIEDNWGTYPLTINMATVGIGASQWASDISAALALYPHVKYWCISLGTNDAGNITSGSNLTNWRADMSTVVNAIIAAGRTPIIARIPYTGSAGYGGGDYTTCNIAYLNTNGVQWLIDNIPGLHAGPNLYDLFYNNRVAYAVTSDPHPNQTGYSGWRAEWANFFGEFFPQGVVATTLPVATLAASGTLAIPGTASASLPVATLAASGTLAIPGTASAALPVATLAGAGAPVVNGTLAASAPSAVLVANDTQNAIGTLAASLPVATLAASGTLAVNGTLATSLPVATLVGAGALPVQGTLSTALPVSTLAASGTTVVAGTLAASLPVNTLVGAGALPVQGTLSTALPVATVVIEGVLGGGAAGAVATGLQLPSLSAFGTTIVNGTASVTFPLTTLAASGSTGTGTTGTVTVTLPLSALAASGIVGSGGLISVAPITVEFVGYTAVGDVFTIKKGDSFPRLRMSLTAGGVPVNLTSAVVTFRMRIRRGTTNKVDEVCTIIDAAGGVVEHAWSPADTDTPGIYSAEWLVTHADGAQTAPTESFVTVVIMDSLAQA